VTVGTILALVILISFLVTLILAVGSYTAYKLREARRPRPIFTSDTEFQFFERYIHTRESQASRERRVAEREAAGTFDTTDPGRTNPGRTNPGRTNPGLSDPGLSRG
jgi:hypothetical protein